MKAHRGLLALLAGLFVINIVFASDDDLSTRAPKREDAILYRKLAIPKQFLTTQKGHTFGGDIRIGDLNGDGRCDFLVYRCNHGAPKGAHQGGMKPCFLGPSIWTANRFGKSVKAATSRPGPCPWQSKTGLAMEPTM